MKPVALIERAIANSSPRGGIVLDLFAGSGTTIIAAERQGRRCYAMELDPGYAQVCIERWKQYTGRAAHLVED
jgi:DNA modification methylase